MAGFIVYTPGLVEVSTVEIIDIGSPEQSLRDR